jgi:hypothetical protein
MLLIVDFFFGKRNFHHTTNKQVNSVMMEFQIPLDKSSTNTFSYNKDEIISLSRNTHDQIIWYFMVGLSILT